MTHTIRDYQRRALDNIGKCLAADGSTLLVAATGTGKTFMLSHAIKENCPGDMRSMVIAHREELITQNAKAIERVLGEPCDIERAGMHADLPGLHKRAKVIVASKDSLHTHRIARFNPAEFGLIVTDEAHRSLGDSYRRIYDHFAGVPHLGVTATPDRHDEEALGQVYKSVAMVYDIADAIHDGYLVPVKSHTVIVEGLNLNLISTTAGDLNQGELAEQLEAERPMHEVAASITREVGDRRAIIFTVSVRQAERLCEILNDYQPDSARWACGTTPADERTEITAAHKAARFKYLVNCGLFTEGYDDPGVSMIVMARPTKSRSLFAQCLGRGTRPMAAAIDGIADAAGRRAAIAASSKPDLLVLDFTGNCGRHKLASPADVLGGRYTQEEREAAAMEAQQEGVDVGEALERARHKTEESLNKPDILDYAKSRQRILAIAKYALKEEDLFDGAFTPGRERAWMSGRAATPSQIATLEKFGFDPKDSSRMSKDECSKIIGASIMRVHQQKATLKQAALLERWGIQGAGDMSFAQASKVIGERMQRFRSTR